MVRERLILTYISHRFQLIADKVLAFDREYLTLFNTLLCGKLLNSGPRNLASRNYRSIPLSAFWCLEPFRRCSRAW